jgi:hypothetical protein
MRTAKSGSQALGLIGLSLLLGCGGSGIGKKMADAGQGSGAEIPDGESRRAPDVSTSPDSEPSKDVGQSRGAEAPDGEGPRVPDALSIDVEPSRSSMACVPAPAEATSLGRVPGYVGGPAVVSVSGQALVVGNRPPWEEDLTLAPKENLLWRTSYPAEPGTTDSLPGYYAGPLLLVGDNLLYAQALVTPIAGDGGWSFDYPQPVSFDLRSKQVTKLPLVAGIGDPQVRYLVAGPDGEIFGVVEDGWRDSALIRWAAKTHTASLIEWGDVRSLRRVGNVIYWARRTYESPTVRFAFVSAPLTGAPVSVLYQWSGTLDDDQPSLIGVDGDNLYLSYSSDYVSGFLAVPLGGGVAKTVVPNVHSSTPLAISGPYLYWVDLKDTTQLLRVRKQGGPVETIWSKSTRYVNSLVVDDCNVYWTVANPSELFVRSHTGISQ